MRNSINGADLRTLQAFVAVCETKSMTKAARVLGVTQSAVSQPIACLEREKRVPLFDRDFRPGRPASIPRGPLIAVVRSLERLPFRTAGVTD